MCNSYDYTKIVSVGSYIEFYDAMSVPMAIALSGLPLLGQPVMVKPSEAEKNLVQSTTLLVYQVGQKALCWESALQHN